MSSYVPTIGLEIHAELKTRTKMFCDCANAPDAAEPNAHICPVCMGHPGTLPVINKEAVRHVLRVGTAVGGTLADFTEFDRKNYFYPDIPKNYQISQYKYPLVTGGSINGVELTRIHLEEDTARSSHGQEYSLVDFNRAGVPLMELVTEPVIHDAETAVSFARELRNLLRSIGASEANLEKGEMRIEANVSIAKEGATKWGTKVEVKNLNSFKAVEQAIAYEVKRQSGLLEKGDTVLQETRGWDENKQHTFSQRLKEESHDYRYFPDPDLPKLYLSEIPEFSQKALAESLPELPWHRRTRYTEVLKLAPSTAEVLVGNTAAQKLFDAADVALKDAEKVKLAANYLTSDVLGFIGAPNYNGKALEELTGEAFAEVIELVSNGTLSSRGAKDLLLLWLKEGGSPKELAKKANLTQVSDADEIRKLVLDILDEHPAVAEEYRGGKATSLEFLLGQCMKRSRGSANPQTLRTTLIAELGGAGKEA